MRHFGLPEEDWRELVQLVKDGGLMAQAGVGAHLRCLVSDCHDFSWFATRFSDGSKICHTLAGSRPGESLADLIYAYVLRKALQRIRQQVSEKALQVGVPFSGEKFWLGSDVSTDETLDGPVWADDATFVNAHPDAQQLVHGTKCLTGIVIDACAAHGMSPNLKRGKTSIVLSLRGKGSRKMQQKLFGDGAQQLSVHTQEGTATIHIMPTYVHLGCAVDRDMTFCTEAHRRVAAACSPFNSFQSTVFQNVHIPLRIRGLLLSVFVESTLFNGELWCADAEKGLAVLNKGFQKLIKRMLCKDMTSEEFFALNTAEVTAITEHAPLHIMLRGKRLRYVIPFCKAAPPVLWALVQSEGQWGRLIVQDLEWLRQTEKIALPEVNETSWPMWWHFVLRQPGKYKAAIKRAVDKATRLFAYNGLLEQRDNALNRRVHRAFPGTMQLGGDVSWYCLPCDKAFRSKCNMACHLFKVHGRKAAHRLYNGGDVCPCCKKKYFDRYRIQRHLQASARCWQFVVDNGYCGDVEQDSVGSKAWKLHKLNNPILCPPVPSGSLDVSPPRIFNNTSNTAQHDIDKLSSAVGELLEKFGEQVKYDQFCQELLGVLRVFPLLVEEYQFAIDAAIQDVQLCFCEGILPWSSQRVEEVCQWLRDFKDMLSGDWLASHSRGQQLDGDFKSALRPDRLPDIRQAIWQKRVRVSEVCFLGTNLCTSERTRVESLAVQFECKLRLCSSATDIESLPEGSLAILQFGQG